MIDQSRKKPIHEQMNQFRSENGELLVNNIPLRQLADRVGQTPFYAYDRSLLTKRAQELRAALPVGIKLHYAMKANPMPAVVGHMAGLVDGIDVASAKELLVALDSGANPHEISFAGPGKRREELKQAVAAGILVNVESFREISELGTIRQESGRIVRVAVRVNPDFELKSSGMKMSGGPKQFGIDAEAVPMALKAIADADLQFEGFHLFAGSQNLRPEAIIEAQQKSYELALDLSRQAPAPVQILNLGGGFGVPYFPGEKRLDLTAISTNLKELQERAKIDLPKAQLVIELGRYLVAEAGIYVCRVLDKKSSRGHTFLVTDGGLHHHLAASGNFGQVIRKNYPIAVGDKLEEPITNTSVSVVGPLCTPLDILGDKIELPECGPGNLIVVFQSGAYGKTASPTYFLSQTDAIEALI